MFGSNDNKVKIDLGIDFALLGKETAEKGLEKLQNKAKQLTADLMKLQQVASNTSSFTKYSAGISALAEDLGKLSLESKEIDLTSVAKEVAYLESVTKSLTKQFTTMNKSVEQDTIKSIDVLNSKFKLLHSTIDKFKKNSGSDLAPNLKQSLTIRSKQLDEFTKKLESYKRTLKNLQTKYDTALSDGDSDYAYKQLQQIESLKTKVKDLSKDYSIYNTKVKESINNAKEYIRANAQVTETEKQRIAYTKKYKNTLVELERQYKILESFKGHKEVVVPDNLLLSAKKQITELKQGIKDTDNISLDKLLSSYNKLEHTLKSVKQNIKDLAPALSKNDSIKIINEYEKKLAQLDKTITNRSHMAPDKNIQEAIKYREQLIKEINKLKAAYQQETSSFVKSGHTHNATLVEARKNISKLNKEVAVLNDGSAKQSHTKFLTEIGKRAATYMGVLQVISAVQTTLANGVRYIAEYDGAIQKLQAVTKVTKDEAKNLEQQFMSLAQTFGGSLEEINKVALDLARAGVASKDLASATKVTMQMALLTGDTFETSTQAIVGYYTTFGKMVSEQYKGADAMEVVGNKLAKIANDSRLTTQDIATSGNYLLQMAKNVGASIDMVGALQVALSNAGLNASTIGTSIARFFTLLKSGSKESKNLFFQLGINTKNFVADLQAGGKTAETAFKTFLDKLHEVDKAKFNNLTSELQILDQKALLGIYNNLGSIQEEFKALNETTSGELNSASIIANSYVNIWERFKNLLGEIATKIKPVTDIAVKGLQSVGWVIDLAMSPSETLDKYNIANTATKIVEKTDELHRLEKLQNVTGNYSNEIKKLKQEIAGLNAQLKYLNQSFSEKDVIKKTNESFSKHSKYGYVTDDVNTADDVAEMARRFIANDKTDEFVKYLDIVKANNAKLYNVILKDMVDKSKGDIAYSNILKKALEHNKALLAYFGKLGIQDKNIAKQLHAVDPYMNFDVNKTTGKDYVGYNDIKDGKVKLPKTNTSKPDDSTMMYSVSTYSAISRAVTNYSKDVKTYQTELAAVLKTAKNIEIHDVNLLKEAFNKQATGNLKGYLKDSKSFVDVITKLSGELVILEDAKAKASDDKTKKNLEKQIATVKITLDIARERAKLDDSILQAQNKLKSKTPKKTIDYYQNLKDKLDATYTALNNYKQASSDVIQIEKLYAQSKITNSQKEELINLQKRNSLVKDYLKLLNNLGKTSNVAKLYNESSKLNYKLTNSDATYKGKEKEVADTKNISEKLLAKAYGDFMSSDLQSIISARQAEIDAIKLKLDLQDKLTKKEKDRLKLLTAQNKEDKQVLLQNKMLEASTQAAVTAFTNLGTGQYKNLNAFLKDLGKGITKSITQTLMNSLIKSTLNSITQSTTQAAMDSATQAASNSSVSVMGNIQSRLGKAMVAYGAGNIAGNIGDTVTGTQTKAGQYGGLAAGATMLMGGSPELAIALGAAGMIYGGMKGTKTLKDGGISFHSTSTDAFNIDTYKTYNKKSWFTDKTWTEYKDASYGIVKQTQDLFKSYNYLISEIGDNGKVFIKAGNYNSRDLAKAFTEQLLKSFTTEYKSFAEDWASYAKAANQDLNQLVTQSMDSYFSELTKVKKEYYNSIGDAATASYQDLTKAYDDLKYIKDYIGVDNVTLENYDKLYKAEMKTRPTPDTIDSWNQLGEALVTINKAEQAYLDSLRQSTQDAASFAEKWDNFWNNQILDTFKELDGVLSNTLVSIESLKNSWTGVISPDTQYKDTTKDYLKQRDLLYSMFNDDGSIKSEYTTNDVSKVYNDYISIAGDLQGLSENLINTDLTNSTANSVLGDINNIQDLTSSLDTIYKVSLISDEIGLAKEDTLNTTASALALLSAYDYVDSDTMNSVADYLSESITNSGTESTESLSTILNQIKDATDNGFYDLTGDGEVDLNDVSQAVVNLSGGNNQASLADLQTSLNLLKTLSENNVNAVNYITQDGTVSLNEVERATSNIGSVTDLQDADGTLPIAVTDSGDLALETTLGSVDTNTENTAEALGATSSISWDEVTFDSSLYTDNQKKNIIDTLGLTSQEDLNNILADLSNYKYEGLDYLDSLPDSDRQTLVDAINALNLGAVDGTSSVASAADLTLAGYDVNSLFDGTYTADLDNLVRNSLTGDYNVETPDNLTDLYNTDYVNQLADITTRLINEAYINAAKQFLDTTDSNLLDTKVNNVELGYSDEVAQSIVDVLNNTFKTSTLSDAIPEAYALDSIYNNGNYDILTGIVNDSSLNTNLSNYTSPEDWYVHNDGSDYLGMSYAALNNELTTTINNLAAPFDLNTPNYTLDDYINWGWYDDLASIDNTQLLSTDDLDQYLHLNYIDYRNATQTVPRENTTTNDSYNFDALARIDTSPFTDFFKSLFADGGYTGVGNNVTDTTGEVVAGIVHAGEWVAPKWMLKQAPALFASLEEARKNGSINNIGFAVGGYTNLISNKSINEPSVIITNTFDLNETNNILKEQLYYQQKMYKILDRIDRQGVGTYTVNTPA